MFIYTENDNESDIIQNTPKTPACISNNPTFLKLSKIHISKQKRERVQNDQRFMLNLWHYLYLVHFVYFVAWGTLGPNSESGGIMEMFGNTGNHAIDAWGNQWTRERVINGGEHQSAAFMAV